MNLGGPGSARPAFSFIDVASKVLAKGIVTEIGAGKIADTAFLEVIPMDQMDVRSVGWAARIVGA